MNNATDVYNEGFRAWNMGLMPEDCPYIENDVESPRSSWMIGYYEAKRIEDSIEQEESDA